MATTMMRSLAAVTLLLVACGVGAASARAGGGANDEAAFGRGLLQTLDCKRVHKACSTCRNSRIPGTKQTELVCSTCAPGWRLRNDGTNKICDCAPGFANNTTNINAANAWCTACPSGKYCLGGNKDNTNSVSTTCPTGLQTIFAGAKSQAQCFTVAGYGRKAATTGNGEVVLSAAVCPRGTFNVGKNTAGCQKCAAGLTTVAAGATASSLCVAPAGSYIDRGVGRLCPKGTYTTGFNTALACTPCDDSITTPAEGSTSTAACSLAKKGFYLTTEPATGDTVALPCPINTYSAGESASGSCTDCPNGWRTIEEGATGVAFCLAPPGWELKAGAAAITQCAVGLYKPDWNRNPCVSCGQGLITDDVGAVAKDDCLVPVGYGLVSLNPMTAAVCVQNTYGADIVRPALAGARCTSCPANTFTLDTLTSEFPGAAAAPASFALNFTSQEDCVVRPGWGVGDSRIEQCALGEYAAGFGREPCQSCPGGYTTLQVASTNISDCVIIPGWEFDAAKNLPRPCDKGSWSVGGTLANPEGECVPCGVGYSTQETASTSASDCNVCEAGYGGSACEPCPANSFSAGGAKVGEPCRSCAAGSVAARNASNSEQCYSAMQDTQSDTFTLSDETKWTANAAGSSAACSAACLAADACATYRWNAVTAKCQLLMEEPAAAQTQFLGWKVADGADYALYTVAAGLRAGEQVGAAKANVTLLACMDACSASNDCEAITAVASLTASGECRLFKSQLDSDWSGLQHVVGSKLHADRIQP